MPGQAIGEGGLCLAESDGSQAGLGDCDPQGVSGGIRDLVNPGCAHHGYS